MFNFYWQERSFYYATKEDIENHIKELNKIVVSCGKENHFFKNWGFEDFPKGKKSSIGELFFCDEFDKYLANRIIPYLAKRFSSINKSFVTIDQMSSYMPNKFNAFLGPRFINVNSNKSFIKNYSDFSDYRSHVLKSTVTQNNFNIYCGIFLKKISLTKEACLMIYKLTNQTKNIFEGLCKIDNYIETNNWTGKFCIKDVQNKTGLIVSDESDTVKQNPKYKELRLFSIPNKGDKYCFIHIKIGDIRIYLYPEEKEKVIYITYIGNHLKTKKYN